MTPSNTSAVSHSVKRRPLAWGQCCCVANNNNNNNNDPVAWRPSCGHRRPACQIRSRYVPPHTVPPRPRIRRETNERSPDSWNILTHPLCPTNAHTRTSPTHTPPHTPTPPPPKPKHTKRSWDYRAGTVLDRFEEHEGPVRGVDFHKTESLLVSGGDDYKIKVWDYKLRRCLFTLLGHLDYIRTVEFHVEHPWILSASDDQTIRLWNWAQRTCMSVLTGHNHYVMCASFHPKEDLLVSASLDQTVRVWDTSGLRKKQASSSSSSSPVSSASGHRGSSAASYHDDRQGGSGVGGLNVQAELFGTNDVVVKYVLEGHDRGVNWAAFHPSLPLLVSGADDRQVKLWRMSETKAWEVDTMRGHTNNVSCVKFHPKSELIISNSEDRSIRVWDMSKRVGVQTIRRENDRFWIMAAHRDQNLLAAGHDTGMIVFKLERERPALDVSATDGRLYFVRGRELVLYDYGTSRERPIANLRRPGQTFAQTDGIGNSPRHLAFNSYNPKEGNVLVCSEVEGGIYEIITFPLEGGNAGGAVANEGKRGACLGAAVFIANNRFAILDKSRQIVIKNLENETTKKVPPPSPNVDMLFAGGASGRLLLRAEDKVMLFEQQSRRVLGEIAAPKAKSAHWTSDSGKVAILCKHGVVIADRNLEQLCSVTEAGRVKSGAWDSGNSIFVYTTSNHIKYCLSNGDTGIIRTLDAPVYVTKVHKKQLFCIDREGKPRVLAIDTTEALFKVALENKKYGQVMEMVRHSRLCGQAIIAYLQQKDFPEVALHFVREPKTRFNLALACGNIEVAMETAFQLEAEQGNSSCWQELGVEALRQGNHQVVEMAYQRTKDFDRLSFLYLLTGNTDKLRKMLKISDMRGDVMGRYENALFLGDASERVKVLEATGNLNLAYVCASIHGLAADAERIADLLTSAGVPIPEVPASAKLLSPPPAIVRSDNWPVLEIQKAVLENLHDAPDTDGGGGGSSDYGSSAAPSSRGAPKESADPSAWGDDDLDLGDDDAAAAGGDDLGGGDGGWGDDDLDLGDDMDTAAGVSPAKHMQNGGEEQHSANGDFFSLPRGGASPPAFWVSNSSCAADHFAAGSIETAMQLLNRQIAATNFECLKTQAMASYLGAIVTLPGLPLSPSLRIHSQRNDAAGNPGAKSLPTAAFTLSGGQAMLKEAYKHFQNGKFGDSEASFLQILHTIPVIVCESKVQANEVKELLEIAREYITAIRVKTAIGDGEDPLRSTELSAYFTHCNLLPAHLLLALRSAMGTAFKHKNFIAAASFSKRLLELPEVGMEKNAELKLKTTKVLQKSEQMARNECNLNYDESKPFVLDCENLTPIYRGSPCIKCSYCGSAYALNCKGKLCVTCKLAICGVETIGLVTGA